MSITPVGKVGSTPTAEDVARLQLERDLLKLAADRRAKANQAQLDADNAAIANDQFALARSATTASSSALDTFL